MVTLRQIFNAAHRGDDVITETSRYDARELIQLMGWDDPGDPYPLGMLVDCRIVKPSQRARVYDREQGRYIYI